MKRKEFGLAIAALSAAAGCSPKGHDQGQGEALTAATSPPLPTLGPFGPHYAKLKPLPVRAGDWRPVDVAIPGPNSTGEAINKLTGNDTSSPTNNPLNTTPKLPLEGDAPYHGDFGSPSFFRLAEDGRVSACGTDVPKEVAALLPASAETVRVTFHFTYVNVEEDYFITPAGKRAPVKQLIQFKPTITQQAPLTELVTQNQPLSWCALYTFTPSDHLMYSGPLDPSIDTQLRSIPIQRGEGWISTLYAGTTLHEPKVPKAMDALLGRLNAFTKLTNGTAGLGFVLPISAAGQIAMQTAQNYLEQVASLLSNPKNELAFNGTPVNFVVTKEPDSAQLPGTLRIPWASDARYIAVAQKHSAAFEAATKGTEDTNKCGISPVTYELQRNDGYSFRNFNYIILQTQVRSAATPSASSAKPSS